MDGILLIDKQSGLSSHDVVYRIKKKLNLSKVGHTGTLDPFATGLLILLIGNATKLAFLFEELDKKYIGELVFGKLYDTDDITGSVIDEKSSEFTLDDIKAKMKEFLPMYNQIPPMYSAIKKNGLKAYQMARRGLDVELEPRLVNIYNFDVISYNESLIFESFVSKGTYIRSLARDLGEKLNTFGALKTLRRTKIGHYDISDAKIIDNINLDDIKKDKSLFVDIPTIKLNDYMIKLVRNGVDLDNRQTTIDTPFIVVDQNDNWIAYYTPDNDKYKVRYQFRDEE